jgi:hypothetical protein
MHACVVLIFAWTAMHSTETQLYGKPSRFGCTPRKNREKGTGTPYCRRWQSAEDGRRRMAVIGRKILQGI